MTTVELRALLAKATPGPMRVTEDRDYGTIRIWGAHNLVSNHISSRDNAALFAAAVNTLPALLDVVGAVARGEAINSFGDCWYCGARSPKKDSWCAAAHPEARADWVASMPTLHALITKLMPFATNVRELRERLNAEEGSK